MVALRGFCADDKEFFLAAKAYIIHENDEWTVHLTRRLDELGVPYVSWHLGSGLVDLSESPPPGVFYNRMSASSHTRGHRYSPELATAVIDWLESHGRTVLNGSNALRLELSKVKQYLALEALGIKTPKTVAAVGAEQIVDAARALGTTPFITKHNRAGKGLGVKRFDSVAELEDHLAAESGAFEDSVDGITLIQQYIDSPEGAIYRAEFVGGKYLYTVRVDTGGSFMLCPADTCRVEVAQDSNNDSDNDGDNTVFGSLFPFANMRPALRDEVTLNLADYPELQDEAQAARTAITGSNISSGIEIDDAGGMFTIVENPRPDLTAAFEKFLAQVGIDVAGIEYIVDNDGIAYTYDVNTNTNYNADAEAHAGKFAMLELARLLQIKLADLNANER